MYQGAQNWYSTPHVASPVLSKKDKFCLPGPADNASPQAAQDSAGVPWRKGTLLIHDRFGVQNDFQMIWCQFGVGKQNRFPMVGRVP